MLSTCSKSCSFVLQLCSWTTGLQKLTPTPPAWLPLRLSWPLFSDSGIGNPLNCSPLLSLMLCVSTATELWGMLGMGLVLQHTQKNFP